MPLKVCFVPSCQNNTENNNKKLFIMVPRKKEIRQKWCSSVEIKYTSKPNICCCEDHFDLEKDMKNWVEYKLMGSRVYMREDVVPHKYLKSPKPAHQKFTSQLSSSARKRKLQLLDKLGDKFKRIFYFEDPSTSSSLKTEENVLSTSAEPSTPLKSIEIMDNVESPSSDFNVTPLEEKDDSNVKLSGVNLSSDRLYYSVGDVPSMVQLDKKIQANIKPKIRSVGVNTVEKTVRSCSTSTEPVEVKKLTFHLSLSPATSFTSSNSAAMESSFKSPSTSDNYSESDEDGGNRDQMPTPFT